MEVLVLVWGLLSTESTVLSRVSRFQPSSREQECVVRKGALGTQATTTAIGHPGGVPTGSRRTPRAADLAEERSPFPGQVCVTREGKNQGLVSLYIKFTESTYQLTIIKPFEEVSN